MRTFGHIFSWGRMYEFCSKLPVFVMLEQMFVIFVM